MEPDETLGSGKDAGSVAKGQWLSNAMLRETVCRDVFSLSLEKSQLLRDQVVCAHGRCFGFEMLSCISGPLEIDHINLSINTLLFM